MLQCLALIWWTLAGVEAQHCQWVVVAAEEVLLLQVQVVGDEMLMVVMEVLGEAQCACAVGAAGEERLRFSAAVVEERMVCLVLVVEVVLALDLEAEGEHRKGHGFQRMEEAHRTLPPRVSRHQGQASSTVVGEAAGLDSRHWMRLGLGLAAAEAGSRICPHLQWEGVLGTRAWADREVERVLEEVRVVLDLPKTGDCLLVAQSWFFELAEAQAEVLVSMLACCQCSVG